VPPDGIIDNLGEWSNLLLNIVVFLLAGHAQRDRSLPVQEARQVR